MHGMWIEYIELRSPKIFNIKPIRLSTGIRNEHPRPEKIPTYVELSPGRFRFQDSQEKMNI
jgi:hypothetical protein